MLSKDLLDSMTLISDATSKEEIIGITKNISEDLGFTYFSTVSRNMIDANNPDVSISHNYPDGWEKLYFERSYFSNDPANRTHTLKKRIYEWPSADSSEFFNSARDFSINSGLTCAVRGAQFTCSVSFASRRDIISTEMMLGAEFLAPYLTNYLVRTSEEENLAEDIKLLTDREVECLRWVSVGKTSWEISVILSISERTVLFHLANSQRKLGTCSRAHSVAKAMVMGLLHNDISECDPLITDIQDIS